MVRVDLLERYNEVEYTLLGQYALLGALMGLSYSHALEEAQAIVDAAIMDSRYEGGYYLPRNFGDIVLGNAVSDERTVNDFAQKIRRDLPQKRVEGVRDEDIRWWWNLSDVERRMMLKYDDACRFASTMSALGRITGRSEKDALKLALAITKKTSPVFGNHNASPYADGEDRPLPCELKNRVNSYLQKRKKESGNDKVETEGFSSLNAFLRKEILAGNL
jgi:hypothetical protein